MSTQNICFHGQIRKYQYFWIEKKRLNYSYGRYFKISVFERITKLQIRHFYFIVSGEINVYLVKIKVVSITSEMILYHFTIVTDTIYIFTPRFGQLRFSSLFQMWILPPLQIFEHL